MSGVPRCPVCKAWLSTDRTIEERWISGTSSGRPVGRPPDAIAPDRWEYRLSCPGCFSVVSYDIAEISVERPRPRPTPPKVLVAGAVVTRIIERLRDASRDEIAAVLDAIVADPEQRTLLRVPEVFVLARTGYGGSVRFRMNVSYRGEDVVEGFVQVSPYEGALLEGVSEGLRIELPSISIIPAGTPVKVLGVRGQAFRLAQPGAERPELLMGDAELLASPDLLMPADRLP